VPGGPAVTDGSQFRHARVVLTVVGGEVVLEG
jgi:hypothetical protein